MLIESLVKYLNQLVSEGDIRTAGMILIGIIIIPQVVMFFGRIFWIRKTFAAKRQTLEKVEALYEKRIDQIQKSLDNMELAKTAEIRRLENSNSLLLKKIDSLLSKR